jgi:hypothetical protein
VIGVGLAALAVTAVQVHAARFGARVVFAVLLFALSVGLLQARKQARQHEADAALEVEFLRLEGELAEHQRLNVPGSNREVRS